MGLVKNWNQTEDAKRRISETLKRRIALGEIKRPGFKKGHFVSKETRKKIGLKSSGRKHSEESKRKMSEAKKNYVPWNKGVPADAITRKRLQTVNIGRKVSDETKKKLSKIVKVRVIKKGSDYISKDHRNAISLAQNGVSDGPLSKKHKDSISAGAALATVNGKHQCKAEYDGVKMQSAEELLFAMWLDRKKIEWEYQPIVFKVQSGVRYVPDFLLIKTGEFVEVSRVSLQKRSKFKLDAFVSAGNILHYVSARSFCGKLDMSTLYV